MTQKRLGIAEVLIAAALFGAVAGGVILMRAVAGALGDAGFAGEAAARVRGATAVAVVLLGGAGVIGAAAIGRVLAQPFRQLRGYVLDRARSEDPAPPPESFLAEAADLSGALTRLAARGAAREADLQRRGTEMAVLLDAISDGILQLSGEGRIVRANPAARTLLRLAEGAHGEPAGSRVRHTDLRRILERAAAGESVEAAELSLDDRRLVVSARPIGGGAEREPGGAVVAFTDITELRRLESVRREFVANVSHELKTPLTSIRGYVETMLTDELPRELQQEFLAVVHKNAERLHRIVEDLLDLSRLESGGWRPELREVSTVDAVEEVWSGCAERAARRHVTFHAPEETLSVRADPGGLRQVLTNLLDNALRHTPESGTIEVRTYLEPAQHARANGAEASGDAMRDDRSGEGGGPAEFVVFEIRDSGTGIPSEALPRIFERFYRVDPARSRAEGGTGLGLSIVKHLVESMGGTVSAESELGRGTVIRFRLPAAG